MLWILEQQLFKLIFSDWSRKPWAGRVNVPCDFLSSSNLTPMFVLREFGQGSTEQMEAWKTYSLSSKLEHGCSYCILLANGSYNAGSDSKEGKIVCISWWYELQNSITLRYGYKWELRIVSMLPFTMGANNFGDFTNVIILQFVSWHNISFTKRHQ